MEFTSAISVHPDAGVALDELLEGASPQAPDLAILFASPHHTRRLEEVVQRLRSTWPGIVVFGGSADGVIGGGEEAEDRSAMSLVLAALPGVDITPLQVTEAEEVAALPPRSGAVTLVMSDPFSMDLSAVLAPLEAAMGGPVVGGQASGGRSAGSHALIIEDRVVREGLVGVTLSGRIEVETLVAQGCRPLGQPRFVTACEGRRILSLDGEDPIDILRDLHGRMTPEDQSNLRDALCIGVQMRDQTQYQQGDYLIRNILGVPRGRPGLAVAYVPERFQVVQLHVRDADAARADLHDVLGRVQGGRPVDGALLFTCVGRGQTLYGSMGHDTELFESYVGEAPIGGMFCNGEVGPVQGTTYLHGYTSVFALFRDPMGDAPAPDGA